MLKEIPRAGEVLKARVFGGSDERHSAVRVIPVEGAEEWKAVESSA